MKHEEIRARLDEFADGTLPEGEERAALVRHLVECRECAEEVRGLQGVLAQIQALARSCDPPRDLWPDLEVAIRGLPRRASSSARGWRRIREGLAAALSPRVWPWEWKVRGALALASILVVVLANTLPVPVRDGSRARGRAGVTAVEMTPMMRALDLQCMGTGKQLLSALEGPPGALTPEAAAVIEENLRIVEQAIEESRSALEADPGNGRLVHMLATHYQRKLLLLHDATRLATEDLT